MQRTLSSHHSSYITKLVKPQELHNCSVATNIFSLFSCKLNNLQIFLFEIFFNNDISLINKFKRDVSFGFRIIFNLVFVLIFIIYIGRELMAIFDDDQISQYAHIIGGICGAFFGFYLNKHRDKRATQSDIEIP